MAPGNEMQESSKFCLKWDGFHNNLTSVFENLRQGEELVDITLCCEGMKLKAHKMMLSAASPFFRDLLQENPCQHPVFFLRDTRCQDMAAIIEFVYRGSVNVSQTQLASFIQTAELLQIRGLSGDEDGKQKESRPSSTDPVPTDPPPAAPPFRAHRQPVSPPSAPRRHCAAPTAAPSGAGRPRANTPPVKRRRVSTTPPPPPPPPPPPVMATPVDPPLPSQPEMQETLVKQEKLEDTTDVTLYDSGVPSSLEQMIFMPQQYPRAMTASALNASSAPGAATISSEDHSQGAAGGASRSGHACPVCGQRYWSLASLHNHISLHRGNTICPVCGQTCSTTSNRNRHMANKHGIQIGWRNGGAAAAATAAGPGGGIGVGGNGGGAGGGVGVGLGGGIGVITGRDGVAAPVGDDGVDGIPAIGAIDAVDAGGGVIRNTDLSDPSSHE